MIYSGLKGFYCLVFNKLGLFNKYFDTPCQKKTLDIPIIINILTLRVSSILASNDSECQNVYNNHKF